MQGITDRSPQVYFWTTIRKNRSKYNLTRGISEDDVTSILLRDVIVGKDPQLAEASLLKLPGLRKFSDSLKTKGEKDHFRRHLRKYINIWLPECPFEVSTTNRYTVITHEAATTARRFIKKNEPIKYLCGYLVSISSEEEKDLDLSRRDFSIVMSSRKKTPSLFLGPARFANHDCNANARLVTQGSEGMQVVAVRDIKLGEEITVTYGDNYFGDGNCECLCATCEMEGRNGWPSRMQSEGPSGASTPLVQMEAETTRPYLFRKTRRPSQLSGASPSVTPDAEAARPRKKRKIGSAKSPLSLKTEVSEADMQGSIVKLQSSGSNLQHDCLKVVETARFNSPSDESKTDETPMEADHPDDATHDDDLLRASVKAAFKNGRKELLSAKCLPHNNFSGASPKSLTDPENTKGIIRTLSSLNTPLETSDAPSDADSVFDRQFLSSSSPITVPSASLEPSIDWKPPSAASPASESELSELSAEESFDDINRLIIRKRRKRKYTKRNPNIIPTIEVEPPLTARYPGDYIRTPLLLGESYSRWVDCRTCTGCWVQQNGYLTRKECPRCERHSKLYGYQWPKTDKRGKGDDEERVLDHRTVHRFLGREEEALVKKKDRGIVRATSRMDGERAGSALEGVRCDEVTGKRMRKKRKSGDDAAS